jgi:hypothetical protein
MTFRDVVRVIGLMALVSACSSAPSSPGPHATVRLKDGSTVIGTVDSSTPTEIRVTTADGSARTIAMAQVRGVDYDDAAAAPAAPGGTPPPAPRAAAAKTSHENHYHPTASVVTTKTFDLPSGTAIAVRTEETIDSAVAVEGQTFAAEVSENIKDAAGDIVIPDGANATIVIVSASKGGRFHDASDLVLDLDSVSVDGRKYHLSTTDLVEKGKEGVGGNKRTAKFVGGGAAIGAVLGAITGGAKGAVIGGGSGAGGGALAQVLTKGESIKVPAESPLTFTLDAPLKVTAAK